MAIALQITDHWSDGKRIHVTGNLVITGNYPAGGDLIPFNNAAIKTGSGFVHCNIQGLGGYDYFSAPSTLTNNAKLRAIVSSTGVELAAGAYPAAITGNPPQFYAVFPKFI